MVAGFFQDGVETGLAAAAVSSVDSDDFEANEDLFHEGTDAAAADDELTSSFLDVVPDELDDEVALDRDFQDGCLVSAAVVPGFSLELLL